MNYAEAPHDDFAGKVTGVSGTAGNLKRMHRPLSDHRHVGVGDGLPRCVFDRDLDLDLDRNSICRDMHGQPLPRMTFNRRDNVFDMIGYLVKRMEKVALADGG